MEKKMDKENINGLMVRFMTAAGKKIKFMVLECILGLTVVSILETGKIILCMGEG